VPGTKMDRFWKERVQIDFGGSDCDCGGGVRAVEYMNGMTT